jgi:anaphase-promoting complex subunit 6
VPLPLTPAFLLCHPHCPCRGAYTECYRLTAAALERDPYATECLPPHLASALELGKKNELFVRGHK